MCSIFAFSRVEKLDLSFREIIENYREISVYNKDIHDNMIHMIPVKDREPINLIEFYNLVFIQPMKDFIISFKNT
jgi:hypothetical protein